jgi:hypothetical protein
MTSSIKALRIKYLDATQHVVAGKRKTLRPRPDQGGDCMDNMLAHDPNARPGGVMVIAVLASFSGLISIGVSALGLFGFVGSQKPAAYANPSLAVTVLLVQGLLGVGYMVVAAGLWQLRRWAFWVAIAASVLLLVDYGFEFSEHIVASPVTVGGLVLPILILLYFGLSRTARHAFSV